MKCALGLIALAVTLGSCGTKDQSSEVKEFSDVQSMHLRADGRYNVICQNGFFEVITAEQLAQNEVCNHPTPPDWNILSVQVRADGLFDVVCLDQSREVATAERIVANQVCRAGCGRDEINANGRCYHFISANGLTSQPCASGYQLASLSELATLQARLIGLSTARNNLPIENCCLRLSSGPVGWYARGCRHQPGRISGWDPYYFGSDCRMHDKTHMTFCRSID